MPLKVPVPVPPIELFAPKAIALLKVALVPVIVKAPALLMPVPLIVMAFVLPKLPLLKLISSKAPLNMPLKVPVPVPPIELFAPKAIALLKVALVPVIVKAPALLMPVPLIVIAFVLPNEALLKLISSAAPLETVVLLVLPKPVVAPALKVPTLTVVVPE